MTSVALHPGAAYDLLDGVLIGWVAAEVLLRLRNLGGRTAFDWTFLLVVAFTAAAINLAFRAAHLRLAGFGGGWAPVAIGCAITIAGIAFRIWAILTLGRFFTFVVVIQEDHHVIDRGPYRCHPDPSAYPGSLVTPARPGFSCNQGPRLRRPVARRQHMLRPRRPCRVRWPATGRPRPAGCCVRRGWRRAGRSSTGLAVRWSRYWRAARCMPVTPRSSGPPAGRPILAAVIIALPRGAYSRFVAAPASLYLPAQAGDPSGPEDQAGRTRPGGEGAGRRG